jgi:DNA-binding NtrC family response regulator
MSGLTSRCTRPAACAVEEGWDESAAGAGRFQEARSRVLASFERRYLERLLADHDGKVAAAAETAGLSRVYLYRLLAKYGLSR